jgi:predicted nucleotidyltransferase
MAGPQVRLIPPPMARGLIEERFKKLLDKTTFTESDAQSYTGHVNSIAGRLRRDFQIKKLEVFGSASRQTAIRQQSDIDLLAVFEPVEVTWGGSLVTSTTVLNRVRTELADRFPGTDLGRDGETIVVPFRDGYYPIDVVPAFQSENYQQHERFGIPATDGQWKATSPSAHKGSILRADLTSGGRLRKTARLAKRWRCARFPELPLSSFHIELLLAAESLCALNYSLAECLFTLFKRLNERECRAIRDPLGISGLVAAAGTEAKRETLANSVAYALDHAGAALRAEYAGDWREAARQWDIIFNGQFPTS